MKKQLLVIAFVGVSMSAGLASAVDSSLVNALPVVDKAPASQAAQTPSALAVLGDKWRQVSAAVGSVLGSPAQETETASCPICPVPPCK